MAAAVASKVLELVTVTVIIMTAAAIAAHWHKKAAHKRSGLRGSGSSPSPGGPLPGVSPTSGPSLSPSA